MISDETRRRALVARHHLERSAPDVLTATRDLVALHSSDWLDGVSVTPRFRAPLEKELTR